MVYVQNEANGFSRLTLWRPFFKTRADKGGWTILHFLDAMRE